MSWKVYPAQESGVHISSVIYRIVASDNICYGRELDQGLAYCAGYIHIIGLVETIGQWVVEISASSRKHVLAFGPSEIPRAQDNILYHLIKGPVIRSRVRGR